MIEKASLFLSLALLASPALAMTEAQAIQEALAKSPVLALRRAEVEQARGRLTSARTYLYNPEIELQGARRENETDSFNDRGLALSQELEISGARGHRGEQAAAELSAAEAMLLHESRLVVARVSTAFAEALRARESVAIELANTELVSALADAARKAMELGAGTQVQTSVALSQLGRARRALHLAEAQYEVARAVLAEVMGSGPAEGPIPEGTLEPDAAPAVTAAEVVEAARSRRADLLALRSQVQAAQQRTVVARREAWPNLVVRGYRDREGLDTVTGGTVGVGIPLFNRNQGAVAEASAGTLRAEAELRAAEAEVTRAGMESAARFLAAQRTTSELRADVVGQLQDSLRLLLRSFEAGKIGFPEVVAFRRELVDAQREYLETLASARLSRIELDLVMGKDAP